jgi:hypothetical protein
MQVSSFQEKPLPEFFTPVMQWFLFYGEPTAVACFNRKSFYTIRSKNSPEMRKKTGVTKLVFVKMFLFSFTLPFIKYVRLTLDEGRPYLPQYSLEKLVCFNYPFLEKKT